VPLGDKGMESLKFKFRACMPFFGALAQKEPRVVSMNEARRDHKEKD
jgi:hypothetical protein